MLTYSDGKEIRVGDSVVLHQGTYTGTVQHVIDSPDDIKAWQVPEVGLMIDTSFGGLVYYPGSSLTAEEIALVTRGTF